jgi:hypothetical protein
MVRPFLLSKERPSLPVNCNSHSRLTSIDIAPKQINQKNEIVFKTKLVFLNRVAVKVGPGFVPLLVVESRFVRQYLEGIQVLQGPDG